MRIKKENKEKDCKKNTQRWLNTLSTDVKKRFFEVVKIIDDERQIATTDYIKLPIIRFDNLKDPDVNSIIKKLNSEGYIRVYQPQGDEEIQILDLPDIILDNLGYNAEILESKDTVVSIVLPAFNQLFEILDEYNSTHSPYSKWFWFDDKDFKFKTIDGGEKTINLSPTKRRGSDTYHLMDALVEVLKLEGKVDDQWLSVEVSMSTIQKFVLSKTRKSVDEKWIGDTKSNLKKIIHQYLQSSIKLSNFNRKKSCYIFGLKLPY